MGKTAMRPVTVGAALAPVEVIHLHGGAVVTLRPARPGDDERLAQLITKISPPNSERSSPACN